MGDEILIRWKMYRGFSGSAMSQRRALITFGVNTQCQNVSVSTTNEIVVVFSVNATLVAKNIGKLAALSIVYILVACRIVRR